MNANQALKDTENALRDFLAAVLSKELGKEWVDGCGVSADRIEKWKSRKTDETRRQETGVVDERLIYYADFYDLKTILKKHWHHFSAALGEFKIMDVWLSELEKLRDPDAHRRELLPHQVHLALGISGEIRTRIVRYRSKRETPEDYFPRIESARDSLGNIWVPEGGHSGHVFTRAVLRPGDDIDYVVTASDPPGGKLRFGYDIGTTFPVFWTDSPSHTARILPKHVRRFFTVSIYISSDRPFHAHGDTGVGDYDDHVDFVYGVLPPK